MHDFVQLEPAIDPNNRISFLLDWEITMKCNLDCSYCPTGLYGGHDNRTRHPDLADCINTIDFMYEYVDLYMATKPKGLRYVILNLYGGESLHHPRVSEIIKTCKDKYQDRYQDRWHLTITTTTNGIIASKKFEAIIPMIDEFTCSYHAENTDKQKNLFKTNVIAIKNAGRRVKVIVLMHPEPNLFADTQELIKWCQDNGIKYLPRQLDHSKNETEFNYHQQQIQWFDNMYQTKTYGKSQNFKFKQVDDKFDLAASGRACCGGRQLCMDGNRSQREFYVKNDFRDWYCSVNEFFLYIKQVNGEIFVNKDCKMSFDGSVAPIGHLSKSKDLIEWTKKMLTKSTRPIIRCQKDRCLCGLCAPKAKSQDAFTTMMELYHI